MKTASPELLSLLATRQFWAADLYQFTFVGGNTLYYCSGDKDIDWNGHTWSAGGGTGPYFDRQGSHAKCHWKAGLEVDTLSFDVLPGSANVQGAPFLTAIQQGAFDGAELTLYRAFMPSYGNTSAGTVILFAGRVAEVEAGRSLARFTIASHLELLGQHLPRNLYQAGCVNTLFDTACGLQSAAFAVTGSALSGATTYSFTASLSQPDGYFTLGKISFTSGANTGQSRTIKLHSAGSPATLTLTTPLLNAPLAGDNFTLYPGCDKRRSTCADRFANLTNFRGFPYVPVNETAV